MPLVVAGSPALERLRGEPHGLRLASIVPTARKRIFSGLVLGERGERTGRQRPRGQLVAGNAFLCLQPRAARSG